MRAKWTSKTRRGIAHLFRELRTDAGDHGLLIEPEERLGGHAMYRRLTPSQRRELESLIRWLMQEQAREGPRPAAKPEGPARDETDDDET